MRKTFGIIMVGIFLCMGVNTHAQSTFKVGTGVYDVTGPAAEVTMAGFARVGMHTGGIYTRLRARSFVIEGASGERVVYVCADLLAIQQSVMMKVIEKLQKRFGDTYTYKNVMLHGNHTHTGPGGYAWYTLYNTYILGFSQRNFDAVVDGIVESITIAHNNVAPARIFVAQGQLENTSINRSLDAYNANVDANMYPSTDNTMTVLKFQRLDGQEMGMLSWFSVHTTSLLQGHTDEGTGDFNNNRLISGDNKGWAERYFESKKGTDYNAKETFIAAFANGTLGDASPNVIGNLDGGGINDFASCEISGRKQFNKAWELYHSATKELRPEVRFRHTFQNFSEMMVDQEFTDGLKSYKTAYGAMGINFTAGVERDGPSNLPYLKEGLYLGKLDPAHGTKLIFLDTGIFDPKWTPDIMPVQMFTIGNVGILAVPAETTTHAGRRMKDAVRDNLSQIGVDTLVLTSPTNTFASYVSTREEYNQQHYEGASTLFGQWTCGAYRQVFQKLSKSLVENTPYPDGPTPPDMSGQQMPLDDSVFDQVPEGKEYGDIAQPMKGTVNRLDIVFMSFWGANPRNTFKTNDSFFVIERKTEEGWKAFRHDYDLDTAFYWDRVGKHQSKIRVMWHVPKDVPAGTYRIFHSGQYKTRQDTLHPYEGYSNDFQVAPSKKLWISNCFIQNKKVVFRLEYPIATEYDLGEREKFVTTGKVRFMLGTSREVYEAKPNKSYGAGYFSAPLPKGVKATSITVPKDYAEDAYGNGNSEFSTE